MQYRTKDGDVLDAICTRHYGADGFRVEDVLEANRGLSEHGPVLPSGVIIQLPEAAASQVTAAETIRLWT